jgi:hypothetical protein
LVRVVTRHEHGGNAKPDKEVGQLVGILTSNPDFEQGSIHSALSNPSQRSLHVPDRAYHIGPEVSESQFQHQGSEPVFLHHKNTLTAQFIVHHFPACALPESSRQHILHLIARLHTEEPCPVFSRLVRALFSL